MDLSPANSPYVGEEIDSIRMDLNENFSSCEDQKSMANNSSDTLPVFIRTRPLLPQEVSAKYENCIQVLENNVIRAIAPSTSAKYRNSHDKIEDFVFSHTFGENADQVALFEEAMYSSVKNFIEGQDTLIFAYGSSGSGKTYTMLGNEKEYGIIPLSIHLLFQCIQDRIIDNVSFKPFKASEVIQLTESEMMQKNEEKENLLNSQYEDADFSKISASILEESHTVPLPQDVTNIPTFENLENSCRNFLDVQADCKFSVWISFVELYNEHIYDLLQPFMKKRRPALTLGEDKNGKTFIKGVKEVNVSNFSEVLKLLRFGRKNLQIATTKLNYQSSRSHCIFNIKVIRLADLQNPTKVFVNTMSFCDLAGSERCGKTQNTGVRLKEASNINTSLMTLGMCIEALRQNPNAKDRKCKPPFRNSKLTRIFSSFFTGRGRASMIVNISPSSHTFDETLNVLKFSALAQSVPIKDNPHAQELSRLTEVFNSTAEKSNASLRESIDEEFDYSLALDERENLLKEVIEFAHSLEVELHKQKQEQLVRERELKEQLQRGFMEVLAEREDFYRQQRHKIQNYYCQLQKNRMTNLVKEIAAINAKENANEQDASGDEEDSDFEDDIEVADVSLQVNLDMDVDQVHDGDKVHADLLEKLQAAEQTIKDLQKQLATKDASGGDGKLAQLQAEVTEKNSLITELQETINDLISSGKAMESGLSEKDTLLIKVKEELEGKVKEITAQQENISRMTSTNKSLEEQIQEKQTTLAKLKTDFLAKVGENEKLEEKIGEKENSLQQMQESVKEKYSALTKTRAELETKAKEIEKLKSEISAKSSKISEMEKSISEKEKILSETKSKLAPSAEKVSQLEKDIQKLKAENKALDDRIKDRENTILVDKANVQLKLEKMEEEKAKNKSALELMEKEKQENQSKLSKVQAEIASKVDKIKELEQKITELNSLIQPLQNQLKEKEAAFASHAEKVKEFDILQKKNVELQETIKKMTAEMKEKDSSLNNSQHNVRLKEEETQKLMAEINDLKSSIESKDKELKVKENSMASLQAKLEQAAKHEEEIAQLKSSLHQMGEELKAKTKALQAQQQEHETLAQMKDELLRLKETQQVMERELKAKEENQTQFKATSEEQISALTKDVRKWETVMKSRTEELNQKEHLISELKNQISSKEQAIAKVKEDACRLASQLQPVTNDLNQTKSHISELQSQLSTRDQRIMKLEQELSETHSVHMNMRNNLATSEKALHDAEALVSAKEDALNKYKQEVADYKSTLEAVKNELAQTKSYITEHNAQLVVRNNQINALEQEIAKLKSHLNSAKEELKKAAVSGEPANDYVETLRQECEKLKALLHEEISQKDALKCEHGRLQEELHSQKTSAQTLEKETLQLRKDIETKNNQQRNLQEALMSVESSHKQEVNNMKQQIAILENSLKGKEKELQENESSHNEAMSNLKLKVSALESTVKDQEEELKEAKSLYDAKESSHKKEVTGLKQQINSLESTIKKQTVQLEAKKKEENMISEKGNMMNASQQTEGMKSEHDNIDSKEKISLLPIPKEEIDSKIQLSIVKAEVKCEITDTELSALREEISHLKSEKASLKAAYDEVKRENDSSKNEINRLQSVDCEANESVDHYRKLSDEHYSQVLKLTMSNSNLSSEKSLLDLKIKELEAAILVKAKTIKDLEKDIREKEARLLKLEESLREKESSITHLEKDIKAKESKLNKAEDSVKTKESKIQELKADMKKKDAKIKEIEGMLKAKESSIQDLEKTLLEKQQMETDERGSKKQQYETEIKNLKESKKSLEEEIKSLKLSLKEKSDGEEPVSPSKSKVKNEVMKSPEPKQKATRGRGGRRQQSSDAFKEDVSDISSEQSKDDALDISIESESKAPAAKQKGGRSRKIVSEVKEQSVEDISPKKLRGGRLASSSSLSVEQSDDSQNVSAEPKKLRGGKASKSTSSLNTETKFGEEDTEPKKLRGGKASRSTSNLDLEMKKPTRSGRFAQKKSTVTVDEEEEEDDEIQDAEEELEPPTKKGRAKAAASKTSRRKLTDESPLRKLKTFVTDAVPSKLKTAAQQVSSMLSPSGSKKSDEEASVGNKRKRKLFSEAAQPVLDDLPPLEKKSKEVPEKRTRQGRRGFK